MPVGLDLGGGQLDRGQVLAEQLGRVLDRGRHGPAVGAGWIEQVGELRPPPAGVEVLAAVAHAREGTAPAGVNPIAGPPWPRLPWSAPGAAPHNAPLDRLVLPVRIGPSRRRDEAEAMTKQEEPWSVEDDWVAEEERWFKEEGRVYYPWARREPRWALPAAAAALTVLALLGLWAVWVAVPRWTVPDASEADLRDVPAEARWQTQDSRRKLRNDARTTLLQGLGGLAVLVGATAALRQVRVASKGQVTERFTRAIDHLGHDSLDVRLGGIYALERITTDSEEDRSTIAEVLTAFVRGRAPWPLADPASPPRTSRSRASARCSGGRRMCRPP